MPGKMKRPEPVHALPRVSHGGNAAARRQGTAAPIITRRAATIISSSGGGSATAMKHVAVVIIAITLAQATGTTAESLRYRISPSYRGSVFEICIAFFFGNYYIYMLRHRG